MGFMDSVQDYQRDQILEYLDADKVSDVPKKMIRSGYASIAVTVIIQMQDILELDTSARINTPATLGGNWCWRMKKEQLKDEDAHRLAKWCVLTAGKLRRILTYAFGKRKFFLSD